MKKLFFAALLFTLTVSAHSQVWISRNGYIRLFSEAPLENIEGVTQVAQAALNIQTGEIYFKAPIETFKFEDALMQEHFNENYMESEKFPNAEFSGTIQNLPDLSKEGTYEVTAAGKFTVHGVAKERTIQGTIVVEKGKITSSSKFKVKCVDHNIEIPTLLVKKIAEELEITVKCSYTPKPQAK
jgi:polyisoprenoid-binding protein YceI